MGVSIMWNRQWILVAGLAACGCVAIQVAGPLAAQQNESAGKSDENRDREREKKQERELDVRYTKAYLRLMDVTLEQYQETNRRQPNTIPFSVMQVIQEGAREARDRAQFGEKGNLATAEIYVSGAESELRAAQESLRRAENANRVSAGNVSASQVEVFKADVELAKVRVEKARQLAAESPLSCVRYELEQLREEVQQLRMFVALLREKD
jgi:hypothetical protein